MNVLDASVIIAYLDPDDAHHSDAEAVIAGDLDAEWGINPLTLAEVLTGPVGAGRDRQVLDAIEGLGIHELPFPADTALRLAGLRATTLLKMPDCCVLLAAETVGGHVVSFDDRLRTEAAARGLAL